MPLASVTPDKAVDIVDENRYSVPHSSQRFQLTEGQQLILFRLPKAVPAGKVANVRVEVHAIITDAT